MIRRRRLPFRSTLLLLVLMLGACSGSQSALDPAGMEADRMAHLFWIMLSGAVLIWLLVIGLAVYAARVGRTAHDPLVARRLIRFGGIAFPTVVLAALLTYGLWLMPAFRAPGGDLRLEVTGEQWWWRVRYRDGEDGTEVVAANEVRLPRGERVELRLDSPDVIHSFWIPSLAGKVDMIPGRTTRLVLEPTRTGTFRGVCAEFCGASHALMAFSVVVMEPAEFDAWLEGEASAAAAPSDRVSEQGRALFDQVGCGGCHSIRGTEANGVIGPDLTHLAARESLGAGILSNEPDALRRLIAEMETVKPGSKMPSFGMLPDEHLDAITAYLGGLE
jgi:cytochrome c oxidase subunit 2